MKWRLLRRREEKRSFELSSFRGIGRFRNL